MINGERLSGSELRILGSQYTARKPVNENSIDDSRTSIKREFQIVTRDEADRDS